MSTLQQQRTREKKPPSVVVGECLFSTTHEYLFKALQSLGGVVGRNPSLPILSNVLLKHHQNQLCLSTTDLEVGIIAWLAGKIHGEATVTVPFRPLFEYVQHLPPEQVTLKFTQESLTIITQRTHAVFQGESAENFPLIPRLEEGNTILLPTPEITHALDAVLYAVAVDETRPELSGVLFSGEESILKLVATDSYRLAEASITLPYTLSSPFSVILPRRAAQEIHRALTSSLETKLRFGPGQLLLITPTLEVICRQIEGTYPDYLQIIPKEYQTRVIVDRLSFLRTLRATSVFSGNTVSRVALEVRPHTLYISATTPEVGETETELVAEVIGEDLSLAFNERFIREALTSFSSELISLDLVSATTPAMLRPITPPNTPSQTSEVSKLSLLALVMPIKL